jgi:hypothetical protein
MRRREFISGLGSSAAWPVVARAQRPAPPVVAWLGIAPADDSKVAIAALHRGLAETGFIVHQNVGFEPVSSDHHLDLLPMLAEDLIRRRVAVLFCALPWRGSRSHRPDRRSGAGHDPQSPAVYRTHPGRQVAASSGDCGEAS